MVGETSPKHLCELKGGGRSVQSLGDSTRHTGPVVLAFDTERELGTGIWAASKNWKGQKVESAEKPPKMKTYQCPI